MKQLIATSCIGLLIMGGCAPKEPSSSSADQRSLANPQTSTWSDDSVQSAGSSGLPAGQQSLMQNPSAATQTIALVNGRPITVEQLQRPLIEAHGLQVLLHLVQLEMAKQKVQAANLTVTEADVAAERLRTLETCFKETLDKGLSTDIRQRSEEELEKFRREEYERLLVPFLETQRITPQEFNLAMQTNAHLRKLAESQVSDKIPDNVLEEAFRVKYGEKVSVRHIQVSNLQEVAEVRRRLETEDFAIVAKALSRDEKSRSVGGLIRPFSRAERFWPQEFKDAAFSLKEKDDLSDVIHTGSAYHIIKLIEKIPPNKAVKFEAHKDILRKELYNLMVTARINQLRQELGAEADKAMKIEDPVLRKQYAQRKEAATGTPGRDLQQIRRGLTMDRSGAAATLPTAQSQPDGRTEVARPPATMPGN